MRSEEEIEKAVDNYAILKEILNNTGVSINEATLEIVQETLKWVLEED